MVSQWLYYSRKNRLKEERNLTHTLNISLLPVLVALPVVGAGFFAVSAGGPMTTARPVHTTGRTLLGIVVAHVSSKPPHEQQHLICLSLSESHRAHRVHLRMRLWVSLFYLTNPSNRNEF